jgi:hypothetical protein
VERTHAFERSSDTALGPARSRIMDLSRYDKMVDGVAKNVE